MNIIRFGLAVSTLLAFLTLALIGPASAQHNPSYQGLFWEISGNGLKKPSYVYGTMHVSNKIAFHLPDSFFVGIKSCEKVALEVDPEKMMYEIFDFYSLISGAKSLGSGYGNYYEQAFPVNIPSNIALARLLASDHEFTNFLLYRSDYNQNFEENTYLDLFIFQAGKKLNKDVIGLENIKETMELSMKASLSAWDEELDYSIYDQDEDIYQKIEDAYRNGDLDMLDSLSNLTSSKSFTELMLYKRNIIMADRMDSIMKRESLFTGVGAAHLPGEKGVIELLRKKGYTVRAVQGEKKGGSKEKDKIDNTWYKHSYYTQFSDDSSFQVSLPGKMLITTSTGDGGFSKDMTSYKEYYYPDMINGAFYYITRVNTFAPLYDLSEEYMYKKIDSLLYENIPGKIIKKKRVVQDGFSALDIVNRTRQGDVQRYRIVITPVELLIFKMSGLKDYVNKEGEKFFSSIKLYPQKKSEWQIVMPKSGGFSLSIPAILDKENEKIVDVGSRYNYLAQSADPSLGYYLFLKSTYHDFKYIEEDNFELDILTKNFYEQFGYKEKEKQFLKVSGYPAIDLKLSKNNSDDLFIRLIIQGPNYYLMAAKTKDTTNVHKYFQSFAIQNYKYDKKFISCKDTTLAYTVNSPVEAFGDKYKALYNLKLGKNKGEFKSDNQEAYYINFPTSEIVKVKYHKYHDFSAFTREKDLWKEFVQSLSAKGSINVIITDSSHVNERSYLLTDTGSVRVIKVKALLKDNKIFTIYANIDTLSKESRFIDNFFSSFRILDSAKGVSLLEDKAERFFKHLSSGDSTLMENSLTSLSYIEFKDKDASRLMSIIDTFNFKEVKSEYGMDKVYLLKKLGTLKDPKVISFLEKQYFQAGDTASIQTAVLHALAKRQTSDAYKTILKLMESELPLAGVYDINGVFDVFMDSLSLCKYLFPDLLKYTRYPEYKTNIYEYMALCVDSGYLKKEVYESYKKDILRDASEELKRRSAVEASRSQNNYNEYEHVNSYRYFKKQDDLCNYAVILMPYYEEDQIKSFYEKAMATKDKDLSLALSLLILKNKKAISDTAFNSFINNDLYRLEVYQQLDKISRLDKFDSTFLNNEHVIRGILYRNSSYSSKDSIVFLDKKKVVVRGKEGYVYFFKRKKDGGKQWKLDYVGLYDREAYTYLSDHFVVNHGKSFQDKDLEKLLQEKQKQISLIGRKRAGGFNDYDYEYDYIEHDEYE